MPAVPSLTSADVLPGASFADRFAIVVSGQSLDADAAAGRAFGKRPAWIGALMALRNLLVWPFGLKTREAELSPQLGRKGMFPVLSQSQSRMVLGLDDSHLELGEGRQEISASTLVRPHNLFGRVYLAIVMPFHNINVPAMLAQVAKG